MQQKPRNMDAQCGEDPANRPGPSARPRIYLQNSFDPLPEMEEYVSSRILSGIFDSC